MGWIAKEGPKCPACKKAVYAVEQLIARDRQPYHHWCVRCVSCGSSLSSRTLYEKNDQLFCNTCYQTIFNPQYFATPGFTGGPSQEDRNRQIEMYERSLHRNPSDSSDGSSNSYTGPKHSIASMVQSSDYGYPSSFSPAPFSPTSAFGQGHQQQQQQQFFPSSGIDVCTLTTIAPVNHIVPHGY